MMDKMDINRALTSMQKKKADWLEYKGGEVVGVDIYIRNKEGDTAKVSMFGRVDWIGLSEDWPSLDKHRSDSDV